MGSKDAPQKMQFLGATKKSGKSGRFYTKRKSSGKPPQIRPLPKHNRSEFQCSCIFQELMNRGKYAYLGLWVKHALGTSSCVSKIQPVPQKNRRITVSVFLSTLQLFALLLKSFRLRLHCYTLFTTSQHLKSWIVADFPSLSCTCPWGVVRGSPSLNISIFSFSKFWVTRRRLLFEPVMQVKSRLLDN